MKITLTLGFVSIVLALSGLLSLPAGSESQPAAPGELPGARPTIDAAQFPTLQAAAGSLATDNLGQGER